MGWITATAAVLRGIHGEHRPVDRAYALVKLGLFEDAMSCCEEALRKSPRNERAWYNLACYCARLRRKDEPAQSVATTSTMTSGDVAGRS